MGWCIYMKERTGGQKRSVSKKYNIKSIFKIQYQHRSRLSLHSCFEMKQGGKTLWWTARRTELCGVSRLFFFIFKNKGGKVLSRFQEGGVKNWFSVIPAISVYLRIISVTNHLPRHRCHHCRRLRHTCLLCAPLALRLHVHSTFSDMSTCVRARARSHEKKKNPFLV